jgi:uncharacterized MnhB-related membrane protein
MPAAAISADWGGWTAGSRGLLQQPCWRHSPWPGGLPPLIGFISKEMIYGATLGSNLLPLLVTGLFLAANVLTVTAAYMTGVGPFFSPTPGSPLHDHHLPLPLWLAPLIPAAMGLMGLTFMESGGLPGKLPFPSGYLHEWLTAGIIVAGAITVTLTDSRLGAVAALGTVGYGVSLVYILYGAPDLAMTQFCIETLLIVLFVLVLYRLPLFTMLSTPAVRLRDAEITT